jgi:hypothetical protein
MAIHLSNATSNSIMIATLVWCFISGYSCLPKGSFTASSEQRTPKTPNPTEAFFAGEGRHLPQGSINVAFTPSLPQSSDFCKHGALY